MVEYAVFSHAAALKHLSHANAKVNLLIKWAKFFLCLGLSCMVHRHIVELVVSSSVDRSIGKRETKKIGHTKTRCLRRSNPTKTFHDLLKFF